MTSRFSGHETFPCRYAWLPKAFKEIHANPLAFADEEQAMIRLGVGKNMVRAIRFWMLETSIASRVNTHGYEPTPFSRAVLGEVLTEYGGHPDSVANSLESFHAQKR